MWWPGARCICSEEALASIRGNWFVPRKYNLFILGPSVVPFYPLFGEGSPTKIDGYPYSNFWRTYYTLCKGGRSQFQVEWLERLRHPPQVLSIDSVVYLNGSLRNLLSFACTRASTGTTPTACSGQGVGVLEAHATNISFYRSAPCHQLVYHPNTNIPPRGARGVFVFFARGVSLGGFNAKKQRAAEVHLRCPTPIVRPSFRGWIL